MTNDTTPDSDRQPEYEVFRCEGSTTRRVNSTLYLGPPVSGNATAEELTWPVVTPVRRGNSHLITETVVPENLTPEELTWPVVDTGSEVIDPRPVPAPVAEPSNRPESPSSEPLATHSPSRSERGVPVVLESHLQSVARDVAALLVSLPQSERVAAFRRMLATIRGEVSAIETTSEAALTEAALGLRPVTSAELPAA